MKLGDEIDFSEIQSELPIGSIVSINENFVTVDFGSTREIYEIHKLDYELENSMWVIKNIK